MSRIGYTQDMPPPGGYRPIQYEKIMPKQGNAFIKLAGLVGFTTFGIISYYKTRRTWRLRRIEQNDARFAVEPLIMAERQRSTMKYWRKLRDEENELMKNVPHWKTGTLYGEPVYYSPRGRFVEPNFTEYYAHTNSKSAAYHRNEARKH
ncbi:NADH dehydrogenase [ubiquinone] 1 alpha subcomplex subunit 13-like [Mytilus californianus]|uniref:NADH dehydrogenase [ubiquinone] 1 alpha subcomplex subunit 13-like n=1 Tax=Mytilus californianus TaxID=6549 RepID=UPI002245D2CC|nr:NADH dehydrogenase [ubiquinone] 1 alpha subcomplex subunit 13-like [Mytilus californianus]